MHLQQEERLQDSQILIGLQFLPVIWTTDYLASENTPTKTNILTQWSVLIF